MIIGQQFLLLDSAASKPKCDNSSRGNSAANETEIVCKQCDFKCKWRGTMANHISQRHGKVVGNQTNAKVKVVIGREVFFSHLPVLNGKTFIPQLINAKPSCQSNFKCSLCNACFVRQDSFNSHMKQHSSLAKNSTSQEPQQRKPAQQQTVVPSTVSLGQSTGMPAAPKELPREILVGQSPVKPDTQQLLITPVEPQQTQALVQTQPQLVINNAGQVTYVLTSNLPMQSQFLPVGQPSVPETLSAEPTTMLFTTPVSSNQIIFRTMNEK